MIKNLRFALARGISFVWIRTLLEVGLVCAIFLSSLVIYRASTGAIQLCDSTYSLVLAEKLIRTGSFDLRSIVPADLAARKTMQGYVPDFDLPYHLMRTARPGKDGETGPIYYGYPIGSTILSLPLIKHDAVDRGSSLLDANGYADPFAEGKEQIEIATLVAASIVVLFYILARLFCGPVPSAMIALFFAVASPVWSTLSRSLWSQTWMTFWLTIAIILTVLPRFIGRGVWSNVWVGLGIGTSLFWIIFCRPQGALSVVAIGIYLLLFERRILAVSLAAGGAWMAASVAASYHFFGSLTPPSVYRADLLTLADGLDRLFWILFSPSRGLLVFCPFIIPVAAILTWRRHQIKNPELLIPAGLAIGFYLVLLSHFVFWDAGYSYGPRLFVDALPWFALASVIALTALMQPTGRSGWPGRMMTVSLVACFGWGFFVHWQGANSVPAWLWNYRSGVVGGEAAAKDWKHPQFLAGITFDVGDNGEIIDRR